MACKKKGNGDEKKGAEAGEQLQVEGHDPLTRGFSGGTGRPRPRARSPGRAARVRVLLAAGRGHTRPRGRLPHRAPSPPRAAQAGAARVDFPDPPVPEGPPPPVLLRPSPRPHAACRVALRASQTHLIVAAGAGGRAGRGARRGARGVSGAAGPGGGSASRWAAGAAGAHLLRAGVRAASRGDEAGRRRLRQPGPGPCHLGGACPGRCARAAGG